MVHNSAKVNHFGSNLSSVITDHPLNNWAKPIHFSGFQWKLSTSGFAFLDRGAQALPISAHDMAPMCAFSILQKWPDLVKNDPWWLFDPENGLNWTAKKKATKHF